MEHKICIMTNDLTVHGPYNYSINYCAEDLYWS